ncbi:sugar ABC transporter permease [bacterium]|nr:sugar ABC transporter permease [bacterium]
MLGVVFYLSKTRGCLAAYTRHDILEGYLFAAPWLIGFIFFTAGPVLVSFLFSFCDYRVLSPARWVGMNNYREMVFEDPLFWKSLWNTAYYTAFHVPLGLCGALLLAVLLNQKVRGMRFFRTIFYIPSIISGVAVSVLWMWILNPEYGILNAALSKIGIQGPGWLTDPAWSKPAIIVMSLWGLGAGMMVLLAALQGIPRHLYESARIDGAGVFLQFIYITVPLLTPALFFNLVIGIIGSFQIFTQAYVMTNGGPLDSTLFYALYLFRTAFQSFRMGYASAMAWILFAVVLSLTLVQMRLAKRWVYYETGGPGK